MKTRFGLALFLSLVPLAAFAADTLVVADGDGKYKPGLAKSFSESGGALVLVLADGVDAKKTAATLGERLAQVKIAVDGNKLTLSGVPAATLLDQLSGLSLSGDADPLAALTGLGGGSSGGESQEGGGSIRAHKDSPLSNFAIPKTVNPDERFEAEVVEVARGPYPQATLKLRIKKVAKVNALKAKLASGKVIDVPVVLTGQNGAVDWKDSGNQRNAGAYYLVKGDKVFVHAVEPKEGELAADWVERR